MKAPLFVTLFMLLFCTPRLIAQCMLAEVPLPDRVEQSSHIIEGEVIAKRSFWDDTRRNIFTANRIKVYKSFKGVLETGEIELITRGGVVDMDAQRDFPSLQVKGEDLGIFFLTDNREDIDSETDPTRPVFQPTTGPQGFIQFDKDYGTAYDPFHTYNDVPALYAALEKLTGEKYEELNPFEIKKWVNLPNPDKVVTIISFSPGTVTAGTDMVLTINGSGFGSTRGNGRVEFSNADNGGASINVAPLADEYCSWSDTQIQVQVPEGACTGDFEVIPNGGSAMTSPSSLNVTYNQLNISWPGGNPTNTYQTQHRDDDGNGGLTWQQFTDFANSPAAAPFLRSLETWCANSDITWSLGNNTTVDVAAFDGINIVRFDNGGELPGGVLGRNTSFWSGCGTGSSKDCLTGVGTPAFQWYVTELDIVFNDGTNWYYGTGSPGGGQSDFESVSVHELGHSHQLGHFCPSGGVMYFAITTGTTNRIPNADEIACAADVSNRSTTTPVCGQPLMAVSTSCSNLSLPVEFVRFEAEQQSGGVQVNWVTAIEVGNDFFSLERSTDGREFKEIAVIAGAGDSEEPLEYSYFDEDPDMGFNYYRLRQVDYDGQFEYSPIRSVWFDAKQDEVSVYPNPVRGDLLNISFFTNQDSELPIELFDLSGKLLSVQAWKVEKGMNTRSFPLHDLPSGIYWLRLQYNSKMHLEKVVKL